MHSIAIVLLSGGIDSTTCAALAAREFGKERVSSLSINYGQLHSRRELQAAVQVSKALGLASHSVINIEFAAAKGQTPLLTPGGEDQIPDKSYSELEGESPTYVPFRNAILLSLAVQSALVSGASWVYWGAHAEDAENWAYPDCTPEFNGGMANAIYIGTYHKVRLAVPFQWLRKYQIVSRAFQLEAPLELTWSCYRGREKHCGTCPTCRARKAAFAQASYPDPTLYER